MDESHVIPVHLLPQPARLGGADLRQRLAASKHNEAIALSELIQECRTLARIAKAMADKLPDNLMPLLRGQAQAVDVAFAKYAVVSAEREEDQKPAKRRAG